ncbi:MAG: hypothetical protein NTW30_02335 [Candidatus Aenigmarchaeota archaeon]|nr:hypothetical protein [Candidatus Aenigmarchaeota archaeon]
MKKLIFILFFAILLSGCIKQKPETTTTTTIQLTTTVTTIQTATTVKPTSKLLSWTKEEGTRIDDGVSSCTIIKDNEYWIYYTAKGIELATSTDGLQFTKKGTVLDVKDVSGVDMVTNPAVFKTNDGKYRMIFEGSRRVDGQQTDRKLYSAISSDGLTWKTEEGIRFQDEGDKPGEMFTSVPDIIRLDDGRLRMYYTRGLTSAIAISNDDGITWTKEKNLGLGNMALDPDIIRLDDGTYKLFYTRFDSQFGVGEQYIMSANSVDGVNFVVDEGKRIRPSSGNTVIVDPDIIKLPDGKYRMYYGEADNNMMFNINSAISTG